MDVWNFCGSKLSSTDYIQTASERNNHCVWRVISLDLTLTLRLNVKLWQLLRHRHSTVMFTSLLGGCVFYVRHLANSNKEQKKLHATAMTLSCLLKAFRLSNFLCPSGKPQKNITDLAGLFLVYFTNKLSKPLKHGLQNSVTPHYYKPH